MLDQLVAFNFFRSFKPHHRISYHYAARKLNNSCLVQPQYWAGPSSLESRSIVE